MTAVQPFTIHVPDEVLADAIRRTVGVCKSVRRDDRIIGPWRRRSERAQHERLLAAAGEFPVCVEHRRDDERATPDTKCAPGRALRGLRRLGGKRTRHVYSPNLAADLGEVDAHGLRIP